jgi:integrase
MPRRAKGLTAAQVEKGTTPGRFGGGGGLYLLVRSREAKFWLFRYTRHGKMREMGLGPAAGRGAFKLAQARAKARELHAIVREGRDPLAEREAEKAKRNADAARLKAAAISFGTVAAMYIAAHEASWRSPEHRRQWRLSLARYVLPMIGDAPVGGVDTATVTQILEPLWRAKTETASRLRGRIESIIDYARVQGWFAGENPARWRGHLDHLLPPRDKVQRVEHFAALDWRLIGVFMGRLRQLNSIPARCLEFAILTAVRSGEARGALWSEVDLAHAVWTIPGERTKSGREHRVPLSEPAMAVLREITKFRAEGLVFPALRSDGSRLSDMTLSKAVSAAGSGGATVHGFRSAFRDWCAEATSYPRELAEAALGHALANKVEAAYQRGDLLVRRRRLMDEWAAFCGREMVSGDVVPLHTVG